MTTQTTTAAVCGPFNTQTFTIPVKAGRNVVQIDCAKLLLSNRKFRTPRGYRRIVKTLADIVICRLWEGAPVRVVLTAIDNDVTGELVEMMG